MNPILQALNTAKPNHMNNVMGLVNALKNGNPQYMFNQLMQSNPQFKQFVEQNKGKSPEQIAKENGLDLNTINSFLK